MAKEQEIPSLKAAYTKLYRDHPGSLGPIRHDSPERSRTRMIRNLIDVLLTGIPNNRVINIGSGPQILEHQIMKGYAVSASAIGRSAGMERGEFLSQFTFITVDIADIRKRDLMALRLPNVMHTQADALSLNFRDGTFGAVISNLCIDFIPRTDFDLPYTEAKRVLATDGTALFNFHHPAMIPADIMNRDPSSPAIAHWQYLTENGILFRDAASIRECLVDRVGFRGVAVSEQTEGSEIWWEVIATA